VNELTVMVLTLSLVIFLLVAVIAVKMVAGIGRKKKLPEDKPMTEVGFVVDTFHDLVSKLKEKERELEALRTRRKTGHRQSKYTTKTYSRVCRAGW
jgi:hypothetical protein